MLYRLHVAAERTSSQGGDQMAQKLKRGHGKNTLLSVDYEAEIPQPLEHSHQVLFMRLQITSGSPV
jgi:hypothetical protein